MATEASMECTWLQYYGMLKDQKIIPHVRIIFYDMYFPIQNDINSSTENFESGKNTIEIK